MQQKATLETHSSVIEGPTAILRLLRLTLEYEGFELIAAVDGRDALRLARRLVPAPILLDVRMPGLCRIGDRNAMHSQRAAHSEATGGATPAPAAERPMIELF